MKIGIIGAGEMGSALIRLYSWAGHYVKLTNSGNVEKLRNLSIETGATAVSLEQVVCDVDVIVTCIPMFAIRDLPKDLFKNTADATTIIDTCNYYPMRDGRIREIEEGMPESIWVSGQLQRPVIKAYNNILCRSLAHSGHTKGVSSRIALPVSGDDKEAKERVAMLIEDSGFDPYDYGALKDSWKQQPGSPVYCTDLTLSELKRSLEKIEKELMPQRRELGLPCILDHVNRQ